MGREPADKDDCRTRGRQEYSRQAQKQIERTVLEEDARHRDRSTLEDEHTGMLLGDVYFHPTCSAKRKVSQRAEEAK